MSKRTIYTDVTPLPAGISRETVLETLHDHLLMIDLNPLVEERHLCKPPPAASPDELHAKWYSITDKLSYLPGVSGNVTYCGCFHNLDDGLQTHVHAPMGLRIKGRWTLGGSLPGEPKAPVELGSNIPKEGLWLKEDVNFKCNMMMASFVKKNLKKSHGVLVERIVEKSHVIEMANANENNMRSEGLSYAPSVKKPAGGGLGYSGSVRSSAGGSQLSYSGSVHSSGGYAGSQQSGYPQNGYGAQDPNSPNYQGHFNPPSRTNTGLSMHSGYGPPGRSNTITSPGYAPQMQYGYNYNNQTPQSPHNGAPSPYYQLQDNSMQQQYHQLQGPTMQQQYHRLQDPPMQQHQQQQSQQYQQLQDPSMQEQQRHQLQDPPMHEQQQQPQQQQQQQQEPQDPQVRQSRFASPQEQTQPPLKEQQQNSNVFHAELDGGYEPASAPVQSTVAPLNLGKPKPPAAGMLSNNFGPVPTHFVSELE